MIGKTEILLPKEGFEKWAAIACDQYTSQPEYWNAFERFVGGARSALRLILPEAYLTNSPGDAARAAAVNQTMRDYLSSGIFQTADCVYVERETTDGLRCGVVAAIDLDEYEFAPGNKAKIRATERTVEHRLPPRMRVRAGAAVELPHVLVLINDTAGVIDAARRGVSRELYSFELYNGAGKVRGCACDFDAVDGALDRLEAGSDTFPYAVGDGNHSLAAAKAVWDSVKKDVPPADRAAHPLKYALVEIVSLNLGGIKFHPIHRLILGAGEAAAAALLKSDRFANDCGVLRAEAEPVAAIRMVDEFACANGYGLDFIHGDSDLRALAAKGMGVGVLIRPMSPDGFFKEIDASGILPQKSFSIGEAQDKRFYIEARRLTNNR